MAIPLLIDTDIVIDYLRAHPDAVAFINGLTDPPSLSALTVAELFQGVRDGAERTALETFVTGLSIVPLDVATAERGGLFRRDFGKSHGVGLADALIAASADAIGAILVTLNKKHFPMLANVLVPYTKP